MSTSAGPRGARRIAVHAFSLALAAAAAGLLAYAARTWPGARGTSVPWWALVPAYLAALTATLEFDFRGQTRTITLSQIPLAVGITFVAPWWHLGARLLSTLVDSVVLRRQAPVKCLFNLANGALEVGAASALIMAIRPDVAPGPLLWLAVFVSLTLIDVLTTLATTTVLLLVGVKQTGAEVVRAVLNCLGTSAVFAGVAIMAVAAMYTDVSTSAVVILSVGALILAYRGHQRLAVQQQQTNELQSFMKSLGALDLDDAGSGAVLENVRLLLYAENLELLVQDGVRRRRYTVSGAQAEDPTVVVETTPDQGSAGPAELTLGPDDHMCTPLTGTRAVGGTLTVRQRMGSARPFALRDLRLLETVAAELGGAIERGRLQRELSLAATTDPLTHLPNLNEASRQLDDLLDAHPAGLLIAAVAVDSFREVNDTLGHQVGDELLVEVGRRLRHAYPDALIGRIGGGRFLVATPADPLGEDPSLFGLGLRTHVEGGAQLGAVGTHIRLSVGCVRGPEHGREAATLVRRAETAMYSARHAHGGPVVWEPAYEVEGQRRLAVVTALREALSSGAIGVAYQPKVAASGGAVTGVEALARWTHPALGAIAPTEFVPLAEAAGLMGPLTSTVLRQALTACKGWQRRGGRVGVAVNVSADTVLDPTFVTEVAALLTAINVAPDLLTLELTEGVVVEDPQLAAVRMAELRGLGVKISVDDFGTGYSSLTYLKGLPVDEVKIDKGFVDGIAHDAGDRAVVRAVVDIAHTLGLKVVAEGVEQDDQHALLTQLGVDELQGYLHARPMAGLDMAQWLRRRDQSALER